MFRTLTEAMAHDHIADMLREAATLRLAATARGPTRRTRVARWMTRLRAATGSAHAVIVAVRHRSAVARRSAPATGSDMRGGRG
jgi:hypothetical protein